MRCDSAPHAPRTSEDASIFTAKLASEQHLGGRVDYAGSRGRCGTS
jgi:hypothetical protein